MKVKDLIVIEVEVVEENAVSIRQFHVHIKKQ